jgi:hypothetical protein
MFMTQQYLRQMSLVVSSNTQAIDFGQFWCTFTVRRGDFQTPNSLDTRIYNVKPATAATISKNEFTSITLSAGYPGNVGLLFKGSIKQFRVGRVNQLDSYVDITAADGDAAYHYATISQTIPAGSKPGSVGDAIVKRLQAVGNQPITQGYQPNFPTTQSVRGKVLFGMARDEMRSFALQNKCKWSIQDGAVTLIPWTSYIEQQGAVPVISVSTGLIGVPEQTQAGINIKTLLNPNYKVGTLIQLDSQINQFRFGLDFQSQKTNPSLALQNQTNQQGLYYVMVANHTGDTRGQNWYTDLVCLSVDATLTNKDQSNALMATLPSDAVIQRYGGT